MNHSLMNSVVSLQALQQKLDVVSNNIANMDTTGYKRQDARFTDVLRDVQPQPPAFQREGRLSMPGLSMGWGMRLGSTRTDTSQGSLTETNQPLDLALAGDAMFEVLTYQMDEDGQAVGELRWTRDGSFMLSMNPDDSETMILTTKGGHFVRGIDDESIQIPLGHQVKINGSGVIYAYDEQNPEQQPLYAGQLKLVRVLRSDLLDRMGGNMYRLFSHLQPLAEDMIRMIDETDQVVVRQGYLENSNVNLADELSEVMVVQRAFQLNSRAIQSADAMMHMANNLRGG